MPDGVKNPETDEISTENELLDEIVRFAAHPQVADLIDAISLVGLRQRLDMIERARGLMRGRIELLGSVADMIQDAAQKTAAYAGAQPAYADQGSVHRAHG